MPKEIIKRNKRFVALHLDEDLFEFLKSLVETRECATITHAIKLCIVKEIERRKYS